MADWIKSTRSLKKAETSEQQKGLGDEAPRLRRISSALLAPQPPSLVGAMAAVKISVEQQAGDDKSKKSENELPPPPPPPPRESYEPPPLPSGNWSVDQQVARGNSLQD